MSAHADHLLSLSPHWSVKRIIYHNRVHRHLWDACLSAHAKLDMLVSFWRPLINFFSRPSMHDNIFHVSRKEFTLNWSRRFILASCTSTCWQSSEDYDGGNVRKKKRSEREKFKVNPRSMMMPWRFNGRLSYLLELFQSNQAFEIKRVKVAATWTWF